MDPMRHAPTWWGLRTFISCLLANHADAATQRVDGLAIAIGFEDE
jgi:hypothetical protein